MIKDKENRAEIVRRLAAQGMNSSQIARETGSARGACITTCTRRKEESRRSLWTTKTLTQRLDGMLIERNAGAAGTGQDQNR